MIAPFFKRRKLSRLAADWALTANRNQMRLFPSKHVKRLGVLSVWHEDEARKPGFKTTFYLYALHSSSEWFASSRNGHVASIVSGAEL